MKKKALIKVMLLVLLIVIFSIEHRQAQATGKVSIKDYNIPSEWATEEIEKAKEYSLTTEKILSNYKSYITREEFCELIMKLHKVLSGKITELPSKNKFKDTTNPEILKANHLGIVNGTSEVTFAPNNNMTREQMAVVFNNLLNVLEIHSDVTTEYVYFRDEDQISSWAKQSIQLMNKFGIVGGIGNDRMDPKGNVTREQAIVIINRTYEKFSSYRDESINESNEIDFDYALTQYEKELAMLINEYRKSLQLKPFSISKSLTEVARIHVKDSNSNHPKNGTDIRGIKGNLHSWSDKGSWEPVVYTNDHEYSHLMWSKPSELTDYKGDGFEISVYYSGKITPAMALDMWKSSIGHNNVIIGEGYWSRLNIMGIGIDGNYSHVWFGIEDDPKGYYSDNDLL